MMLTPFEWVLVLGALSFLGFFLQRDFRTRDDLAKAVSALTREVFELRSWISQSYVSKDDHRREIDRLTQDIKAHAEQFQQELEAHRNESLAR